MIIDNNQLNKQQFLHWWWYCESGDVDFHIEFFENNLSAQDKGQLFWPKLRLLTEFVPESRKVCSKKNLFKILISIFLMGVFLRIIYS